MTSIRKVLRDPVWDWLFRLIASLSLVAAAIAFFQTREFAACQQEYNEHNNRRTRILTQVAERERMVSRIEDSAFRTLWLDPAVVKPVAERTPEEQARIIRNFQAWIEAIERQRVEQERADNEREANPVPPPPSQLC